MPNPEEMNTEGYMVADLLSQDEQDNPNDYELEKERLKEQQMRMAIYYNNLSKTGYGSYLGLGIIGRNTNSYEYEKAIGYIKHIATAENPSGADVKDAVDAVKDYLDDKMTDRSHGYAKERFDNCMQFLSETMPRRKFENYCMEINKARGVENRPNSSDYLAPELFIQKGTKARDLIDKVSDSVLLGNGSIRDIALIIAVRNMNDKNGELKNYTITDGDGLKTLKKEVESIMADSKFQIMVQNASRKELEIMLNKEDGYNKIADYKNYPNNLKDNPVNEKPLEEAKEGAADGVAENAAKAAEGKAKEGGAVRRKLTKAEVNDFVKNGKESLVKRSNSVREKRSKGLEENKIGKGQENTKNTKNNKNVL